MRSLYSLALLTVAVTASPADPWHHRSHPGWQKPSVYTPSNPKTTLFASYPYHHPSKTTSAPTGTSSASKDACASIAGLVAPMQSASPSATPTVPAQLAYDCITSIPFNSSAAVALLDSMRPYIKWQTTIEYLKDPPAEYAEKVLSLPS